MFLSEQLEIGFSDLDVSLCLRERMAVWLFLRASALSAPPREGCLAVPLVPASRDCNTKNLLLLTIRSFLSSRSHGDTEENGDTEERQKPIGKTGKDRRVAVSP